jgi:hypothetical protein
VAQRAPFGTVPSASPLRGWRKVLERRVGLMAAARGGADKAVI